MKKLFVFLTLALMLTAQAYAVNYYRQPQQQRNYVVVPRGTRVIPANPQNYSNQNNGYYNQNVYSNSPYTYNNQNYNYQYDRRNQYYNQNNSNNSTSTGAEIARTIIDALGK